MGDAFIIWPSFQINVIAFLYENRNLDIWRKKAGTVSYTICETVIILTIEGSPFERLQ